MTSFLALYRGETVSGAKLVALSADPELVTDFATRLIADGPDEDPRGADRLRLVAAEEETDGEQRASTRQVQGPKTTAQRG